MDVKHLSDKELIVLWNNFLSGMTEVAKTIDNGTFHTPKAKGGAPPSQAGQLVLWMGLAVDQELNSRGIPAKKR
jgi:hypothetical protein